MTITVSWNIRNPTPQGTPARVPPRIVLVEDNPADAALLRHALDEVGESYVLEVLADGEAALEFVREHCRSHSSQPCLIVLELYLPLQDGLTLLRAIRSEPRWANVAIAMLHSGASPAQEAEVLRLGVQMFRAKPMDLDGTFALARDLLHLCTFPELRAVF
jgi:CheY-like chemotaxis protein